MAVAVAGILDSNVDAMVDVKSKETEAEEVGSSEDEEDEEEEELDTDTDAEGEDEVDGEEDEDTEADDEDEGDDEDDDEGDDIVAEDLKLPGLAGMGDVIGKILDKEVPASTNVVLCKSKKSRKRKEEAKAEYVSRKEKEVKLAASRELNHVVPTRGGNAHAEVALKRVATRGVVKLLNAVSQHQKNVSDKMKEERTQGGKDKVVDKVNKPSNFMELLKKNPVEKKKKRKLDPKAEVKEEEEGEEEEVGGQKWSVLRDDFMLGSTMKDWDKLESGDDENKAEDENDEESSSDDEKG